MDEERDQMVSYLREKIDVFAWQLYKMPDIDAEVMYHKSYIDKNYKPIKQKPKRVASQKPKVIKEEVHKLLG